MHPKALSNFNDEQLSTINPKASLVILRHHDISKLDSFLEHLASERAVFGPICQISQKLVRSILEDELMEKEVAKFQIKIPLPYYSAKVPSETLQSFL